MTTKESGRNRHRAKGCERLLAKISPVNRDDVALILAQRRNRGISTGSNENWLRAIGRAEEGVANGRPFKVWTATDLTMAMTRLRDGVADRTFELHAVLFRHFLKELHGDDDLPKHINKATKVTKTKRRIVGNLVR